VSYRFNHGGQWAKDVDMLVKDGMPDPPAPP